MAPVHRRILPDAPGYIRPMNPRRLTSALISVYNKEGLEPVVRALASQGVRLISTGGTFDYISGLGLAADRVEDLTEYPAIFGGRVKTLHPAVFGGILQRRDHAGDAQEAVQYGIPEIDLVIVDLYPFVETVEAGGTHEEIIEKIDIGGVSLLRAAAKNYASVLTICSKDYYEELVGIIAAGATTTIVERRRFSALAFGEVLNYDEAIADYMTEQAMEDLEGDPSERSELWVDRDEDDFEDYDTDEDDEEEGAGDTIQELRYGENPHQAAQFEGDLSEVFEQLHGKELSYNNLLDLDAAINLVADFDAELEEERVCCAIIKHNNACGIAVAPLPVDAWKMALAADPVSAFGGVIALNCEVEEALAREIDGIFFEILIATDYSDAALEILKRKKNRIILLLKEYAPQPWVGRAALNGYLFQDADLAVETAEDLKTVTERQPTAAEQSALLFAARVCKHTKSNAIVLARQDQMLASGMGQTSRVDALQQAIAKAQRFGFDLKGAVMASDAFFPFPDCVEIAAAEGVAAVIQPGGSVKDQDSIDAANRAGMAMVFTGRRHFRH